MVRQSTPEVEPSQTPEPNVPQEPEQVGRGSILVRTRPGHVFVSTLSQEDKDFPHITSVGVKVTRQQADQIVAEAEAAGGVGYVTEVETD